MKPLLLTLAGLNSFIEEQAVDFEALSRGGLFGIAGKTGSGKTTILDAMIIALYGGLSSRGRCNADFINLKSAEARIGFLFELVGGGGRRRFLVERKFARKKGGECKQTAVLSEIVDGAAVVLAEDANKVDAKLFALLGLKAEDFCQCIVLQQGEFARFLNQKPVERINAIGRIFSLEEYGERLNERVKKRISEIITALARLQGERAGVGDVTAETVAAMEREAVSLAPLLAEAGKRRSLCAVEAAALKTQAGKCAEYLKKSGELAAKRANYARLHKEAAEHENAAKAAAERKAATLKTNAGKTAALLNEQTAVFEELRRAQSRQALAMNDRERLQRENLAAALSEGLKPGGVCPICGETIRGLTPHIDGDLEAAIRALKNADDAIQKCNARNAGITKEIALIMNDATAAREDAEIARFNEKRAAAIGECERVMGEGKQLFAQIEELKAGLPEGAEPQALRAAADAATEKEKQAAGEEDALRERRAKLEALLAEKKRALEILCGIEKSLKEKNGELDVAKRLQTVLTGKALMGYVAEEQIYGFTENASRRLASLTNGRFYLEYENSEFVVLDNMNGGLKRGVSTLSGGETFLVSLSLALAISEALAAGSDRVMEFFFLDEGFGTLDNDLIDTVMDSLERLRHDRLQIGLISHRTELMQRIAQKITVTHANEFEGSRIEH